MVPGFVIDMVRIPVLVLFQMFGERILDALLMIDGKRLVSDTIVASGRGMSSFVNGNGVVHEDLDDQVQDAGREVEQDHGGIRGGDGSRGGVGLGDHDGTGAGGAIAGVEGGDAEQAAAVEKRTPGLNEDSPPGTTTAEDGEESAPVSRGTRR